MSEILSEIFLKKGSIDDALIMMKDCLEKGLIQSGITFGKYLCKVFPFNPELYILLGDLYFKDSDYSNAYDMYCVPQNFPTLNQASIEFISEKKRACIPKIKNRYTNPVSYTFTPNKANIITFTITSCKRYELFRDTMNSFLNCCLDKDLIDRWICIDDNSSEEDREKAKKDFPFFEFYFKTPEEKGHPQSMNIIKKMVKSPYLFHMEDDWVFFEKRNYITETLCALSENIMFGQCLINRNYMETEQNIVGGAVLLSRNGMRYYIHEHPRNEEESKAFEKKYGENVPNCAYWPHFSLRPSMIRTLIFDKIGDFNTTAGHFEMEYAKRYCQEGFYSLFLEGIYCYHIGRLTNERFDNTKLNAYILNGEKQFEPKANPNKTFVINLDSRADKYSKLEREKLEFLSFSRYSAINGDKLTPNKYLDHIFEGNDYNMKAGMVGCAMSHLKLWITLLSDSKSEYYTIFEDDVILHPKFPEKYRKVVSSLPEKWDVVFLGHIKRNPKTDFSEEDPVLQKWNTHKSLLNSLGGTASYIISKKGARSLLEFINNNGMENCIDTMMQRFADSGNVYYCIPEICSAPFMAEDSDVQKNKKSLTFGRERSEAKDRLKNEKGEFDIEKAIVFAHEIVD